MTLWESLPREQIRVPRDALYREIAVPAAMPGAVSLPAAERLAARFYADLTTLAGPTGTGLRRVLAGHPFDAGSGSPADASMPDTLEDDPRLALRLMAADVEQLWRDQLIAAAALALVTHTDTHSADSASPRPAGSGAGGEDPLSARCLLVYRLRPWSPTPSTAVMADLAPHAVGPSAALPARLPRGRLALLLSWTLAIARRSWAFPRQVYTFQWEPMRAVTLDLAAPTPDDDEDGADEWMICRPRRRSAPR